ncbi:MAG: putative rane family protein [Chlamydiales bacterium]|nr:putative rane family protein [Chlamydiales bacterium]
MSFLSLALALFLVANPIGNTPAFVALVKDYPFEKQKRIMQREWLISLALALFFLLIGQKFLDLLCIKQYAVSIAGGFLLLTVSLDMIFPSTKVETESLKCEPLVVPIATPLITGPGCIATIMLFAKEHGFLETLGAILTAWTLVGIVLIAAPYVNRLLGRRGLIILEQLMGMVVSMISLQMIVQGTSSFLKVLLAQ